MIVLKHLTQQCYSHLTEVIHLEMWGYCLTSEKSTLEDCFGKEGLHKVENFVGDHMIVVSAVGEAHLSTFGWTATCQQIKCKYTLSIITSQLHCFQLRTTLNGKDFKFFPHRLCTEKQNILLQHMHEK